MKKGAKLIVSILLPTAGNKVSLMQLNSKRTKAHAQSESYRLDAQNVSAEFFLFDVQAA
jgi:hypothetical protein